MHPLKSGLLTVFLCSLMVYLCSCVKGLCGNTQITAHLTWKMEFIISILLLINGLFSTYLSVIILWMLSILCVYTTDELEKQLGKGEKLKQGERCPNKGKSYSGAQPLRIRSQLVWCPMYQRTLGDFRLPLLVTRQVTISSAADSIVNAEKFLELFQVWLYEEQTMATEIEPLEEKIYKLQIACKELKRVQIIIESLKTQTLYCSQSDIGKSMRSHDLLDKFDYVQAYMELRLHMLIFIEKLFLVFLEQGKELKIWLSEAAEFQEDLHHVTCDGHLALQQLISQSQVISKQSKVIAVKLENYRSTVNQLTAILQEIGSFSDGFQIALRRDTGQHQKKKWSDTLLDSVTEEMTQVEERFSTILKLNTCYQTHLQGLLQDLLQHKT
ncbi:uncharacterized protein ACMZJ9_014227 [Mantella aurantiaca]